MLLSVMALSSMGRYGEAGKTGRPLPTPPQKEAPKPVLVPLVKPVAAEKIKEQKLYLMNY